MTAETPPLPGPRPTGLWLRKHEHEWEWFGAHRHRTYDPANDLGRVGFTGPFGPWYPTFRCTVCGDVVEHGDPIAPAQEQR